MIKEEGEGENVTGRKEEKNRKETVEERKK